MSGENRDYLYLLEKALKGMGLAHADAHVSDLVGRVKRLETPAERRGDEAREPRVDEELSRMQSSTPDEFDHMARTQ